MNQYPIEKGSFESLYSGMNADAAWHSFEKTGSVVDYLAYRAVRDNGEAFTGNADNNQWNRNPGKGTK